MKISVFRLNYKKGSLLRVFSSAVAQMTASGPCPWAVRRERRGRAILKKQLVAILAVIGLLAWAFHPLTEFKALARHVSAVLGERLVKPSTPGVAPLESEVALQNPNTLKFLQEPRRPRVVAIDPLPMLENTEQVVIISVEIQRPDGKGFDTKKQWIRFMSHPMPSETPELSEPKSHF